MNLVSSIHHLRHPPEPTTLESLMFRLSILTLTSTFVLVGFADADPGPRGASRPGGGSDRPTTVAKDSPVVQKTTPSTTVKQSPINLPNTTKTPDASKIKLPPVGTQTKTKPADGVLVKQTGTKKIPDAAKVPDLKKLPDVKKLPDSKTTPDTKKTPDSKKGPDIGKKTDDKKGPDTTKGPKDKTPHDPKIGKDWKHHNPFPNYHRDHGHVFAGGYYYSGKFHRHWSFCTWDTRYGCYCYWDPCCSSYYYWCQPDACFYPVSYCPYRVYTWTAPVCNTCALPAPVDTSVTIAPCQTCPPAAVQTQSVPAPAPTQEPPTAPTFDTIPAVPEPANS